MSELLAFVRALRVAGLSIGTDRIALAAEALTVLPDDPYTALRVTLCMRQEDLATFDAVWHAWSVPGHERPASVTAAPADDAIQNDAAQGGATPEAAREGAHAGDRVELIRRDVQDLTAAERAEIELLIAGLAPATRRRPATRRVPARTGPIDVRRTVRLMLRAGGEPSRIVRSRRGSRPRPLLILLDTSGSMSAYSDAMLRFAHAAVAAGPTTTEIFAFGTRWTRLTAELRCRGADAAMRAVGEVESDWAGGTRLGPALRDFLRGWGGRTAVRGAVVVIGSDGLETGRLDELPRQVARLSRLGHSLIWVNPAWGIAGYEPVNPALTESLRHATVELPGHTFEALRRLAEVISR